MKREEGLNRNLKKRMVKTMLWSVVLYVSKTWIIRKEDIRSERYGAGWKRLVAHKQTKWYYKRWDRKNL